MNENIEIKDAFYVTKDEITPVKAFKFTEATHYNSSNDVVYRQTEKGWAKTQNYAYETMGYHKEIAWSKEEAEALKMAKMKSHLEYLEKEQLRLKEQSEKLKQELNR